MLRIIEQMDTSDDLSKLSVHSFEISETYLRKVVKPRLFVIRDKKADDANLISFADNMWTIDQRGKGQIKTQDGRVAFVKIGYHERDDKKFPFICFTDTTGFGVNVSLETLKYVLGIGKYQTGVLKSQ